MKELKAALPPCAPRFGLIAVDHATQGRSVRPSARRLGALASEAASALSR